MTSQPAAGHFVPPRYTLIRRLYEASQESRWLAMDGSTNGRVVIRFMTGCDEGRWREARKAVSRVQGLVHDHIARPLYISDYSEMPYVAEPCFPAAQHFSVAGRSRREIRSLLSQLLDSVDYAHQSGIPHGHLYPGNLLVDGIGKLQVTGFGLPGLRPADEADESFLSPQARSGEPPDLPDDIYAIGALVFWCLTGKHYSKAVEPDTPLPRDLKTILDAMLSDAPYDRLVNFTDLEELLKNHLEGSENAIRRVAYSRSEKPAAAGSGEPAQVLSRDQSRLPTGLVYAGLVALILVAAVLFLLLPGTSAPKNPVPATLNGDPVPARQPVTGQAPADPTPLEQAQLDLMREEAEKIAREILRLQIEVEDVGAHLWAREELENMAADMDAAEGDFRNGLYEKALNLYRGLQEKLTELRGRANRVFAESISTGDAALESGDPARALEAFSVAAAIEPHNPELAAKMKRAEMLPEVLSLVIQAEKSEREGNPEQALELFRAARNLDGLWKPARSGISRLTAVIEQQRFREAMSRGFAALARKNHAEARDAFDAASRILPSSPEPADGLLQVEQTEKADRIRQLQVTAEAAFAGSDWQQAIDAYREALAIDGSLVFASKGLSRAEHRLNLETGISAILADPAGLQDDDLLSDAVRILAQATRLDRKSAKTKEDINKLAQLVSTARIEIPVTIVSDNRTDITIYKVSHLGPLETKQQNLIPGRYTLVGKRQGYRDVRKDITVLSGEQLPPITLVCDERI